MIRERRGTYVALGVAIAIAVLLVVLQPGPKPVHQVSTETTGPAASTTTTVAPGVQLCLLARQFVRDAATLDANDAARVAEVFYEDAAKLVDGATRAEFEAAARYYAEYNEIGEAYDYDVYRIAAAGKGDRWARLLTRPPLGIETARAAVQFACTVELPVPPTRTTVAPTEDPLTSLLGRGASGATGGSGGSGASGSGGTATSPASTAPPATTAR